MLVLAPLGYVFAPSLLDLVNAAPAVQAEALPFLRIMFMTSSGMLVFFMLGGALRSAGDARTPMILGFVLTALNIAFNVVLIRGLGPIPAFRHRRRRDGDGPRVGPRGALRDRPALARRLGGTVPPRARLRPRLEDHPRAVPVRPAGGLSGHRDEHRRACSCWRSSGSLAESAPAQAAYAVSYTQLFSFVTWTSIGLMGAAAAVAGQNLGAGRPDRTAAAVHIAARIGMAGAACMGLLYFFIPGQLLAIFGIHDPARARRSAPACSGS